MKIKDITLTVVQKKIKADRIVKGPARKVLRTTGFEKVLREAVADGLRQAGESGADSVAFPNMGAGTDLPVPGIARIMTQEVYKVMRTGETGLSKVTFCVEGPEYSVFKKTVNGYLEHLRNGLGFGPYVTVDIIIELSEGIILIERSNPPYGWALPGGFVDYGESLETAAAREAQEETNMDIFDLKQLLTYSDPRRDDRFHTVSTVFVAQGKGHPQFGDDAKGLKVVPYEKLLTLSYAFDHGTVIRDYLASKKDG